MRHALAACVALSGLCLAAPVAAQPRPAARPRPAALRAAPPVPVTAYTVRPGDTCASIAGARYRDRARTDLVHTYNPGLGPPPHRLRPGQTLQLPTRVPAARGPLPVALVTQTRNRVELSQDDRTRPAQALDPLFRGNRVSTLERASAEVTFADETQIRLSEQTLVVILGDTSSRVRRLATARDTVLQRGTLRAFLGTLAGDAPATAAPAPAAPAAAPARPTARPVVRRTPPRPVQRLALRTASGRVTLTDGESQLTVGADNTTTLAVYSGQARIQSGTRTVAVPEGYAVRASATGQIAAPRPLPPAPRWLTRPPAVVLTDDTATLRATWAPGIARPPAPEAPARWHVQAALDPSFLALHHDATPPGSDTSLALDGVQPGRYHLRVSALDAESLEGPFTEAATVTVVRPRVIATAQAHRATAVLPGGIACGLDDDPLRPTEAGPLDFDHLRAHTLRCGATPDDPRPATLVLPAETRGPFTVVARLVDADPVAREGRVRVQVVDAAGERIAPALLAARADTDAVTARPVRPDADPAVGLVDVAWSPGAQGFALRLTVDGREETGTATFTLPPPPPPPPPPPASFGRRVTARAELLGGAMLPTYQTNTDPARFDGNTLAMTAGASAALRLGVDLFVPQPHARTGPLTVTLGAGGWLFPRGDDTAGRASTYTAGLRWMPLRAARWGLWVDAAAGVVFTGAVSRLALEASVGFDLRLSPRVGVGPMVRYFQIVQPESDPFPVDARVLAAGAAFTWRFGADAP